MDTILWPLGSWVNGNWTSGWTPTGCLTGHLAVHDIVVRVEIGIHILNKSKLGDVLGTNTGVV